MASKIGTGAVGAPARQTARQFNAWLLMAGPSILQDQEPLPSLLAVGPPKGELAAIASDHVRIQPVFSLIEPPPQLPQALQFNDPRAALGNPAFVLPRALFYFDPPPATQLAAIQPVPEPDTVLLLLAGLGVIGAATRFRRRQAEGGTRASTGTGEPASLA